MANKLLKTPEGRTSFMKVFQAEDNFAGNAKEFSLKFLIPKKDVDGMNALVGAWNALITEEFEDKAVRGRVRPFFSEGDPMDDKGAVMDGDWKYDFSPEDKKDYYEAYQGHWVLTLKAPEDQQPAIVGMDKIPITKKADFDSGDYAYAVIELSAYTSKKFRTPQVTIRLKAIQKTREGERFSGGSSTEAAMDLLEGTSDDMTDLL